MSYYPNGAPYPPQPYGVSPYPQQMAPTMQYTETTTTYVTPAPPPPQVTEVVVVENQQQSGMGAGAVIGAGLAGMAVGMVVEDALDW